MDENMKKQQEFMVENQKIMVSMSAIVIEPRLVSVRLFLLINTVRETDCSTKRDEKENDGPATEHGKGAVLLVVGILFHCCHNPDCRNHQVRTSCRIWTNDTFNIYGWISG